jgi:hypothetical protein
MWYILEGRKPKKVGLNDWAKFIEKFSNKIVKQERKYGVRVSTVFLGLDHSWNVGPPVLFETMIFGGELDGYLGKTLRPDMRTPLK